MKFNFALISSLAVMFSLAFWYSLTTTLDDMTRRDCLAGVEKACSSLEQ